MHWVDRGLEPDGLETVRSKFTKPWVGYYQHGVGADRLLDGGNLAAI